MTKKYIIYIWIVLFVFSCQSLKEKNEEVAVVEIDIHNTQKHTISEFIDSVRFIKLETSDDCLIKFITNVSFDNNKIIIAGVSQKQVLVFNDEGAFINKIHRVGQGPGEYLDIARVLYDSVNKNIIIRAAPRKIQYYTLDGTLIREIPRFSENAIIRDIINLPNGNFLCYTHDLSPEDVGDKASGLWEVDFEGNFVRSIFTSHKFPVFLNLDNSKFQLLPDNKIKLTDAVTNDIYYLEDDTLRKVISHEIKNDISPSLIGLTTTDKKYIKISTCQEKEGYFFTYWSDDTESYYSVYSKKTNKNILVNSETLWETFDAVKPTITNFAFKDNNRFDILVTALYGETIMDYLNAENNNSQEIKNRLREVIEGMSEKEILDMNPVLQLLYVKKE